MRKINVTNFRFHSGGQGPGPGQAPNQWMAVVLAKWLILAASVMLAAYLIDNIEVSGFLSAIFAAAAIGVLNLFFRPVLLILTLPINVLSLGLFTFIINALMLKMASGLIPGFSVVGFWSTVFGAIVISAINWVLNAVLADTQRPKGPGFRGGGGPGPSRPDADESIDMKKKGDRWE